MTRLNLDALVPAAQAQQIRQWLGDVEVLADMSWNLGDTKVLHLQAGMKHVVAKTGGELNHHIVRELLAHRRYTGPLIEAGKAAKLLHASDSLRLMILDFQPGELSAGSEYEFDPEFHRQAGAALKLLHSQASCLDPGYEARLTQKFLLLLEREHRIEPAARRQIEQMLRSYEPQPAVLVPTHGDWQPRNWLADQGELRVIDFGRFEFRPAASDLARLAVQQWKARPDLEAAFLQGYGHDPRERESWRIMQLREGLGTAVWAHQVGDRDFEAQGLQMLAETLAQA
ncbi:phosphotransferase [Glutamicibacter nicotianae]|uniref:phosphotransferase n=1 Tax=Glutamicibacter nicotianae TaxID=37929 RepID=UPI001959406F|nr:phosphotransferase [Glutamicibacter nicotianae]MBM7768818.1 hypothetical protein [Glutamicibacter nicotianae]